MRTSQVIDFIRSMKKNASKSVKQAEAQKVVNEVLRERSIKKLLKG